MTQNTLDRLTAKQERLAFERKRLAERWASDPVAWVNDCIVFPEGEALADYQTEELATLGKNHRVAVRGPRGSRVLSCPLALLPT